VAELLSELRSAVIAAATVAMQEMELQMVDESYLAIEGFEWEWNGPVSDQRSIIDTGNLMNSVEIGNVELKQNRITFSLTWDPVDPETGEHYAELVHNGEPAYFEDDDGFPKDYTARPWTFLLIPAEQRDDSQVRTDTGPTPESLPEDGWESALQSFKRAMGRELSRTFKVLN